MREGGGEERERDMERDEVCGGGGVEEGERRPFPCLHELI